MSSPIRLTSLAVFLTFAFFLVACGIGGENESPKNEPYRIPDFVEDCPDYCGAKLSITNLTLEGDFLSFDISIENTGQLGTMSLDLRNSLVMTLNEPQAQAWKSAYPSNWRDQSTLLQFLNAQNYRVIPLSFGDGFLQPLTLAPGQTWTGRAGTIDTLPVNAVGVAINIGLVQTQRETPLGFRAFNWFAFNETTPYIGLQAPTTTR